MMSGELTSVCHTAQVAWFPTLPIDDWSEVDAAAAGEFTANQTLYTGLSVCLFVCLPVCLSVCLFVCLSLSLSLYLSLSLSSPILFLIP